MKLTFFKTSTTISKTLELTKNDLQTAVAKHLANKDIAPFNFVTIVYIFTSEHGRGGSKFAAKLGESGDTTNYFLNKDKKYQITGRTKKLKCDENEIVQIFTAKIEMALTYNCSLTEWNIVAEDNMHK